ncbi:hypothetical protein OG874_22600 [Nocardia sp. NBC_00565]|uniref:hypothetical protein n=1 Tax=Nocardia sp. NBC_00565 TaxID=2975993 RepID=UPI002E8136D8|nr:hypothetical protein [Nocardia sp. NBC_00565]WUC07708.1 hypothetical protein OG874_22600 [Nocardia sp. NBC_00565]
MTQVIKVFTPIKRVPTMIGKAQNGQKLPFGPYTLPQVAGAVVMMSITSVCAMTFPANPAVTFIVGLVLTIATVFGLGLVPYTGVRMISRAMWVGRLIVYRKPVSASGMPVDADSARMAMFVEESVVIILPDYSGAEKPVGDAILEERMLAALGAGGSGADLSARLNGNSQHPAEGRG